MKADDEKLLGQVTEFMSLVAAREEVAKISWALADAMLEAGSRKREEDER